MSAGSPPITRDTTDAEAEWIRQVAQGARHAAQRLVDAHLASITRFAYRMLGSVAEAEDVAQEVFFRLWRQAPTWEPRARLGTWLHRVAHNLCIDRLRSRREVRLSEPPDDPDSRPSAPSEIERHEAERAIHDAIQSLPERQRAALVLVYYQGLDNRQAADIMGVHIDALESLLARARRSLRGRLMESGGPVSEEES